MFGLTISPWIIIGAIVALLGGGAYGGYHYGYLDGQSQVAELQKTVINQKQARIDYLAGVYAKLKVSAQEQKKRDDDAYKQVVAARDKAKTDYEAALAQLRIEQRSNHAINPDTCILSAAGRVLFDKASGARPEQSVSANPNASGGAHGGSSPDACVTIDQLQTGYLNLGQHDRAVVAQLLSLQSWARVSLRGTAP